VKGGDFSGNMKGTYKQEQVGTYEVELNTLGTVSASLKADKFTKGLVLKASGDERPMGKFEADYAQDIYTTGAAVEHSPAGTFVDGSVSAGTEGFAAGGGVKYDVSGGALAEYNGGVEYSKPEFTTTLKTTGAAARVLLQHLHKVKPDLTLGAQVAYDIKSGKTVATGGLAHKLDVFSAAKLKADSEGFLASVFEHKFSPAGVKLQICSEFNVRNWSTVPERFGLALVFGYDN